MSEKLKCGVPGCDERPCFEVILFDVYPHWVERDVHFQQDSTCPYLCLDHMGENEQCAVGVREPRGHVKYPFTNQHHAQGFTIYRPLEG